MEITFHWHERSRWLRYAAQAVALLLILRLWAISREEGDRGWLSNLGMFYLLLIPYLWLTPVLYVLTDRTLLVVNRQIHRTWVPLATAELVVNGPRQMLRWRDGRRRPTHALPRGFALTAALEGALAHPPADGPTTEKEAARTLAAGWPLVPQRQVWPLIAGVVVSFGLAIWINQPLFLLPLAVLPSILHRTIDDRALVLTPTDLWLISRKAPAVRVPRTAILRVGEGGWASATTIFTAVPELPEIRVNGQQSAQLLEALRFPEAPPARASTAEKPKPAPAPTPTHPFPGAEARCSLCGRPLSGASHPGDVHICELCGGRARHQAAEAGHGLTGKERKPM